MNDIGVSVALITGETASSRCEAMHSGVRSARKSA